MGAAVILRERIVAIMARMAGLLAAFAMLAARRGATSPVMTMDQTVIKIGRAHV